MFLLNLLQSNSNPLVGIIIFLTVIVGFLVAIVVHEFAHAYVANKFGDPTAKMMGRLTLNPLAHLDPIGAILFLVIGFGWAKPVPINVSYLRNKPDELKVAFAGIIANIFLAVILAIPIRIALLQGHLIDSSLILQVINWFVDINIMLAAFNLIPIPPLDGSHLIEYFLSEESKLKFNFYGQYALVILIFYGMLSGNSIIFSVMEPIMRGLSLLIKGTYSFLI